MRIFVITCSFNLSQTVIDCAFKTEADAKDYLNDVDKYEIDKDVPTAYVDGSFNSANLEYSFGAILLINGEKYIFKKKFKSK